MQPLEQHEDALEVLRLDADAVIGDAEVPLARLLHRADMDMGRELGVRALELLRLFGELVVRTAQLRLGVLALGDVRADAAVAAEAAVLVIDRLARHRDPARAAGGSGALHLEIAKRLMALERRA